MILFMLMTRNRQMGDTQVQRFKGDKGGKKAFRLF